MRIEREWKQSKVVEEFFDEFYQKDDWDKKMYHILAVILAGIQVLCMLIPVQYYFRADVEKADYVLMYVIGVLGIFAAYCYLAPYVIFREKQQICHFKDKLRYIPIEKEEFQTWRLQVLVRFQFRVFLCCLAAQISFAVLIEHAIGWENLLYTLILGFVVPLGLNIYVICREN